MKRKKQKQSVKRKKKSKKGKKNETSIQGLVEGCTPLVSPLTEYRSQEHDFYSQSLYTIERKRSAVNDEFLVLLFISFYYGIKTFKNGTVKRS